MLSLAFLACFLAFISADSLTAAGGNLTFIHLTNDSSTLKWQGFYGNVSGLYAYNATPIQQNASGGNLTYENLNYTFTGLGYLLVTNSTAVIDMDALQPGPLAWLDAITGAGDDSATNTFPTNSSVVLNSNNITDVPVAYTYSDNAPSTLFPQYYLTDGDNIIFAVPYEEGKVAFNGSQVGFQFMVPTPSGGSATYYLWFYDQAVPSPSPSPSPSPPPGGGGSTPTPSPDPSPTAQPSPVPSPSAQPSPTVQPTATATVPPGGSATVSPTPFASPTVSPPDAAEADACKFGVGQVLLVWREVIVEDHGSFNLTKVRLTLYNEGNVSAKNVEISEELKADIGDYDFETPPSSISDGSAYWVFDNIGPGEYRHVYYEFQGESFDWEIPETVVESGEKAFEWWKFVPLAWLLLTLLLLYLFRPRYSFKVLQKGGELHVFVKGSGRVEASARRVSGGLVKLDPEKWVKVLRVPKTLEPTLPVTLKLFGGGGEKPEHSVKRTLKIR